MVWLDEWHWLFTLPRSKEWFPCNQDLSSVAEKFTPKYIRFFVDWILIWVAPRTPSSDFLQQPCHYLLPPPLPHPTYTSLQSFSLDFVSLLFFFFFFYPNVTLLLQPWFLQYPSSPAPPSFLHHHHSPCGSGWMVHGRRRRQGVEGFSKRGWWTEMRWSLHNEPRSSECMEVGVFIFLLFFFSFSPSLSLLFYFFSFLSLSLCL